MNTNIIKQEYKISRKDRNGLNNHSSFVLWFTGLSGSGKSTLANALEQSLFEKKFQVYVLDGDNIRLGINKDLDFTKEGRKENIRRVAEISKLMVDAGTIAITSFISPFKEDREMAKNIIGTDNFIEVFVDCPLEVCEQRDVKGLYAKARTGAITNFTGIKSDYEAPTHPNIIVNTSTSTMEECIAIIFSSIEQKIKL